MKICPICLKEPKSVMTREHLPAKSLYKVSSEKQTPAIIKICYSCNQKKSIYDQEILALYGHLIDFPSAEKAKKSLRKINQINNANDLSLYLSREATKTGKALLKDEQTRGDIVSLWLNLCSRGIYYFFERNIFNGITEPIPQVENKIYKKNFLQTIDSNCKKHVINDICQIALLKMEGEPDMITIALAEKNDENSLAIFRCAMFESEKHKIAFFDKLKNNKRIKNLSKQFKPNIVKPNIK